MKICINRAPVIGPWGGGNNFVKALSSGLTKRGHAVAHKITPDVDVIFAVDPRYDELGISANEMITYRKNNSRTRLVYRVNECDARKGLTGQVDPLVALMTSHADATVFISEWLRDHHASLGASWKRSHVIINGVSEEFFVDRVKTPSDKIRIVTHHWSNNAFKGHDVYEAIDAFVKSNSNYMFQYIGRPAGSLPNTNVIPPVTGEILATLLADNDVYVSGSRWDPGPNHVTESLACRLPTYVRDVGGGAVEMVGRDHTYADIDQVLSILRSGKFERNVFVPRSWDAVIADYISIIESLR